MQEFAKHYPQIRLVRTGPPSARMDGQNWACQQLSATARGIICIPPMPITHAPNAVENTVRWMQRYDLSMLSAFPQQQTESLLSSLPVPIVKICFVLCRSSALADIRQRTFAYRRKRTMDCLHSASIYRTWRAFIRSSARGGRWN